MIGPLVPILLSLVAVAIGYAIGKSSAGKNHPYNCRHYQDRKSILAALERIRDEVNRVMVEVGEEEEDDD